MLFSLRVVVGLLNSFKVFHIITKSLVINSYNYFLSFGSSTIPFPISKRKQQIYLQGLYQCWVAINFQTYQLELVLDIFKTLATNLILILEFGKGWLLASMW
jgi:hypothetical protein